MRKLVAAVVTGVFAVGSLAPVAWAQGTKPMEPAAKTEAKPPAKSMDKPAGKPMAKPMAKKAKVDINSAPDDALKGLGLSDEEAKKVVDGRPWKRKDELVKKNVVSKETYAKIKDEIVAAQPKTAAKKTEKK